jgi:hypothetical protein
MNKIEKVKQGMIITFYFSMALAFLSFTFNYGLTDWGKVSSDFDSVITKSLDGIRCEIEYKAFKYVGLCNQFDSVNSSFHEYVLLSGYEKER